MPLQRARTHRAPAVPRPARHTAEPRSAMLRLTPREGPAAAPRFRTFQVCLKVGRRNHGLYMRNFFRSVRLCAVCLLGLAVLSPLAAQSPVDQQAAEGTANIYNLDRDARVGGVEIHDPIGKA